MVSNTGMLERTPETLNQKILASFVLSITWCRITNCLSVISILYNRSYISACVELNFSEVFCTRLSPSHLESSSLLQTIPISNCYFKVVIWSCGGAFVEMYMLYDQLLKEGCRSHCYWERTRCTCGPVESHSPIGRRWGWWCRQLKQPGLVTYREGYSNILCAFQCAFNWNYSKSCITHAVFPLLSDQHPWL